VPAIIRQMFVNTLYYLEFFCHMEQHGYSTVRVASDFLRDTFGKSLEEVLGASEIGQDNGSGLTVDSTRFNDAPVGLAP